MDGAPVPSEVDWALVPLAFAALAARAAVIAGESALSAVGEEEARELAVRSGAGRALVELKADPERTTASIRAAQTLSLAVFASAAALLARSHSPDWLPGTLSVLLAVLGAWLVTVLTDVLPRSLAASHPTVWARRTAWPLLWVRRLLGPVTRAVGAIDALLLRPFGAPVRFTLPPPPLDELQKLIAQSSDEAAPEPALVRSLFEFGERTVKEIMVPRTDVQALPLTASAQQVLEFLLEEGHTRTPVYDGTLDHVVGIVHVKDVLPLVANPELILLHDLLRPAHFVPWNRPIAKVLRELQRTGQHLSIVVDEYGGVAGIVTLEDVMEQIVGDIRDEFDEEEAAPVVLSDGTATVRADMHVEEFNERFGAELPEHESYETLAGFIYTLAGALPAEGDVFFSSGFEFRVTRREPRRVVELQVTRVHGAAATREE